MDLPNNSIESHTREYHMAPRCAQATIFPHGYPARVELGVQSRYWERPHATAWIRRSSACSRLARAALGSRRINVGGWSRDVGASGTQRCRPVCSWSCVPR